MESGIYELKSKVKPTKFYIGSAFSLKRRELEHRRRLLKKTHPNIILQRHVNKYGIDDLEFNAIEYCDKNALIEREQFYIDKLIPLFNICKVAGSSKGVEQSLETRAKRGKAQVGKFVSAQTKKLMSSSARRNKPPILSYINHHKIIYCNIKTTNRATILGVQCNHCGNLYERTLSCIRIRLIHHCGCKTLRYSYK